MNHRLQRLIDSLAEQKLDGLLVSLPENRRYLSGFTGSAGYLLVGRDQAALATDSRYTEQAAQQAGGFQIVQSQAGWDWLAETLKQNSIQKLGFESEHLTVAAHQRLLESLKSGDSPSGMSLVSTSGVIEQLRVVKDAEEMALLQKAVDASDSAIDTVCPTLRAGMSEREVARRMEQTMWEFGAEGTSFNTIVASGPNAAMPHHRPSDRAIQQGEPVIIDMGAKVGGYCSDITRTVVIGEEDQTFRKVYDIVLGAQLTAISIVRPGITGGECDSLSRTVIQEAGYGEYFGHSLGHGVGLAVHESPRVGPNSNDTLETGTVFTVEPGIYLPGWGGVRIEDIVLLEDSGARSLSQARK